MRSGADATARSATRVFRTPVVGEALVKGVDAFKRGFLFRQGVVHRERLTPTVKRAYRSAHQGWSERTAILVFPPEIPVTGEFRDDALVGVLVKEGVEP